MIFIFFNCYHLAVRADGWLEVRPGLPWMASFVPTTLGEVVQLPIAIDDLEIPATSWDADRLEQRALLLEGRIGGFANHPVNGYENWLYRLEPELSEEARLRFAVCDQSASAS